MEQKKWSAFACAICIHYAGLLMMNEKKKMFE